MLSFGDNYLRDVILLFQPPRALINFSGSFHYEVTVAILGNLRTTTKFTTTTSVDRESTGTRTSVSAGKRKLKMQSLGRTTTALNVNTKLFVRDKVFWQWRRLKQCKIFFF